MDVNGVAVDPKKVHLISIMPTADLIKEDGVTPSVMKITINVTLLLFYYIIYIYGVKGLVPLSAE